MKSYKSENVPGLELDQTDQHPGAPPGVLAQGVQQGQGVGGEVEESEEEHGDQDQGDGGRVQEQHREYQIVGGILSKK